MVDKDVEEVREILSVVSTEVPKLLNAISESLFGAEQTTKFAEAVSGFYKSLREAGMEESQAFELTRQFMDRTNLLGMIQEAIGKGDWSEHRSGDWESEVERKIKAKIKQKFEDEDWEIE